MRSSTLTLWCMTAGALFMSFGPLLVLTPEKKITVVRSFARMIVGGAHKKETRYTAFAGFAIVFAAQVCVHVAE